MYSLEDIKRYFAALTQEIELLYFQKFKLRSAFTQLEKLYNSINYYLQSPQYAADHQMLQSCMQYLHQRLSYDQMRTEMAEVSQFLSFLKDPSGWSVVKESEDSKISYKHENWAPTHSLKIEGIIKTNLFYLLACIYETDLYAKWVPHATVSETLAQLSLSRKVAYSHLKLPLISDRDFAMYGYGVDDLDTEGIIVIAKNVEDNYAQKYQFVAPFSPQNAKHVPAPPRGCVRLDTKMTGFLLVPLDENTTKLQLLCNVDPKLSYVPYSVLNFFTRQLAFLALEKFREVSCSMKGTIYEERIKNDTHFYGYLQNRLYEYFNLKKTR